MGLVSDPAQSCTPSATGPTLDTIWNKYLSRAPTENPSAGCAQSGCHADGQGDLKLTTAAELVAATDDVAAPAMPSEKRIVAGSPQTSYLLARLSSTQPEKTRMPSGGPYLTDAQVAEIAAWICDGAHP
jgi:hypothetical protein